MAQRIIDLVGAREARIQLNLAETDVAGNRTRWEWYADYNNAGTSAFGTGNSWAVSGPVSAGAAFTITAGSGWMTLGGGEFWHAHDADGGSAGRNAYVTLAVSSSNPNVGSGSVTVEVPPPTIPRATTATFTGGTSLTAGSAVTINLPRASGSFTHDISYVFQGASGTVATGAGASYSWTPALSLLSQIPDAVQASGYITVTTKSGSTVVGSKITNFNLAAPVSVVPAVSSLSVSDQNPDVVSIVGAYVQGLSLIRAVVNASGAYGSTVVSRTFTINGVTVDSGEIIPLTLSGTVAVTARVVDSRGRVGTWSGSFTALSYDVVQVATFDVSRATSGNVLSDDGAYLRLTLNASISSLVNSTQRNAMTIKVFTRPVGTSTWTARNTITTGLSYNTNVLISGGGVFAITTSYEVRVEVADKFATVLLYDQVPTSAILMHMKANAGVGIKKYHEQGALDVGGDIYANGLMVGAFIRPPVAVTDIPSSYPAGVSVSMVDASDWPSQFALVITYRYTATRTYQEVIHRTSGLMWRRAQADDSTWNAWVKVQPATQAEVNAGTEAGAWVTPATLATRLNGFSKGGLVTATTDGNGDLTITHGLGTTPIAVVASLRQGGHATIPNRLICQTHTYTSTTFKIRFIRTDDGTALGGNGVTAHWIAQT